MRRTSAIGPEPNAEPKPRRARRAGFTLVELLIVILIVSLATGVVLLTAPPARNDLRLEALRLAAKLTYARDEATVGGRAIALRLEGAGYAFDVRDGPAWRPLREPPFRPVSWEDGTRLAAEDEAVERVAFDGAGYMEPVVLRLSRDGALALVEVDAAGEVRLGGLDAR